MRQSLVSVVAEGLFIGCNAVAMHCTPSVALHTFGLPNNRLLEPALETAQSARRRLALYAAVKVRLRLLLCVLPRGWLAPLFLVFPDEKKQFAKTPPLTLR